MEHTVSAQHMEALKALADTNLKMSESRALLTELEETETSYLIEREEKAVKVVIQALEKSREIVLETKSNYDDIQRFYKSTVEFKDLLLTSYEKFKALTELFDKAIITFETIVERNEAEILEQKKILATDRVKITNDKKSIIMEQQKLVVDNRRLDDGRETLSRAIKRLKNNEI